MKKSQVKVGGLYTAKVSDKLVTVRIDSAHSAGGWNATNTRTGKRIRIKSAQRLRGGAKSAAKAEARETTKAVAHDAKAKVVDKTATSRQSGDATSDSKAAGSRKKTKTSKPTGEQKPKRVSALDAAAQVLKAAGKPMRAQELIAAMAEQNLWKSPGGATPHATLYAAMMREARDKGSASRFTKVDRGQFQFNKESK